MLVLKINDRINDCIHALVLGILDSSEKILFIVGFHFCSRYIDSLIFQGFKNVVDFFFGYMNFNFHAFIMAGSSGTGK